MEDINMKRNLQRQTKHCLHLPLPGWKKVHARLKRRGTFQGNANSPGPSRGLAKKGSEGMTSKPQVLAAIITGGKTGQERPSCVPGHKTCSQLRMSNPQGLCSSRYGNSSFWIHAWVLRRWPKRGTQSQCPPGRDTSAPVSNMESHTVC